MSFSLAFTARSKSHALAELERYKTNVPAPVHAFLKVAIENIGPQTGQELRAVEVSATGHLAEDKSSYSCSNGELKVRPLFAPD
jgi:hypothetical protein